MSGKKYSWQLAGSTVESSKWKVERKDGKTKINTVESGKWKVESVKSSGK